MSIGKLAPVVCKRINMRRLHFGCPIATEITVTEIIGENKHYIRLLLRACDNCGRD